jgi:hypothetical protein
VARNRPEWVHDIHNFAWDLPHVNIHECLSVDILHQLYKGVFTNLIDWISSKVTELIPGRPAPTRNNWSVKESNGAVQLDARFRAVPAYLGLKYFANFSQVTQWTGDEQKDVLKVLLPVITPLLMKDAPDAIVCARAVVDFIMIAQYKAHDEETISYMENALERLFLTKGAFDKSRVDSSGESHWNYAKFHALSHYPDFVRRYGAPDGYNTDIFEAGHKHFLKEYYNRTNKSVTYQEQIALHNTRSTNLLAMDNIFLTHMTTSSMIQEEINSHTTIIGRDPIDLINKGIVLSNLVQQTKLRQLKLNPRRTTTAREAETATNITDFTEALTVYVRQMRNDQDGIRVPDNTLDSIERDST